MVGVGEVYIPHGTILGMTLGILEAIGVVITTLGTMVPVGAGVGADLGITTHGAGEAGMVVTTITITTTTDLFITVVPVVQEVAAIILAQVEGMLLPTIDTVRVEDIVALLGVTALQDTMLHQVDIVADPALDAILHQDAVLPVE